MSRALVRISCLLNCRLAVRPANGPIAASILLLLPELLGRRQHLFQEVYRRAVSEQTYYRWRTKYGGMDPQMAKQLQELQKENARLKRLVAEQALDNQILREAARPNW